MSNEGQKHPMQLAFEQNLKFLNQPEYPTDFWRQLFTPGKRLHVVELGQTDFPGGEVALADPLAYLGTKYQTVLERRVPAGSYPVQLAVMQTQYAGLRYAAARLLLRTDTVARYELAMPKGHSIADLNKPGVFSFFGVDTGLACFADTEAAQEYQNFARHWYQKNAGKNIYDDYFAELFQQSYLQQPKYQREGGDFVRWQLPESGHWLIMFASGLGDGIYSGYWGLNADDQPVELVAPFMNPALF